MCLHFHFFADQNQTTTNKTAKNNQNQTKKPSMANVLVLVRKEKHMLVLVSEHQGFWKTRAEHPAEVKRGSEDSGVFWV